MRIFGVNIFDNLLCSFNTRNRNNAAKCPLKISVVSLLEKSPIICCTYCEVDV